MNKNPDYQKMREELQKAAQPLVDYLYKYGQPYSKVIVGMDKAEMLNRDCVCKFEGKVQGK